MKKYTKSVLGGKYPSVEGGGAHSQGRPLREGLRRFLSCRRPTSRIIGGSAELLKFLVCFVLNPKPLNLTWHVGGSTPKGLTWELQTAELPPANCMRYFIQLKMNFYIIRFPLVFPCCNSFPVVLHYGGNTPKPSSHRSSNLVFRVDLGHLECGGAQLLNPPHPSLFLTHQRERETGQNSPSGGPRRANVKAEINTNNAFLDSEIW